MSSGSPRVHVEKPGDARRAFIAIANAKRSFGGKKESTSMTPMRLTGGCCTASDERGQVRALTGLPCRVKHGREENVLRTLQWIPGEVNADQSQKARDRDLHAFVQQLGIVNLRRREGSEHRYRYARCAPGGVDGEIGGGAEALDTRPVLSRFVET